jgi:hypothetical protein
MGENVDIIARPNAVDTNAVDTNAVDTNAVGTNVDVLIRVDWLQLLSLHIKETRKLYKPIKNGISLTTLSRKK